MSTQQRLGRSATSRLGRLHAAQQACCFYCGREIALRLPGEAQTAADATVDHFFPKAGGGQDSWSNWVLACRACNHAKANRQPTAAELERWNALAAVWPHIRPIAPELVRRKRCAACGGWISPTRLGDSIKAGAETSTCMPRCGRAGKRRAERERWAAQARAAERELAETGLSAAAANVALDERGQNRLLAWCVAAVRAWFAR